MPVLNNCKRFPGQHGPHYFDSHRWCNGAPNGEPAQPDPIVVEVDAEVPDQIEAIPTVYRFCEECRVLIPLPGHDYVADVVLEADAVVMTLHVAARATFTINRTDLKATVYPKHGTAQQADARVHQMTWIRRDSLQWQSSCTCGWQQPQADIMERDAVRQWEEHAHV